MQNIDTMMKIARLPDILKAASLLKFCGLIEEEPAEVVKRYVNKNPDINKAMGKTGE
jgi:hypothetical protein